MLRTKFKNLRRTARAHVIEPLRKKPKTVSSEGVTESDLAEYRRHVAYPILAMAGHTGLQAT